MVWGILGTIIFSTLILGACLKKKPYFTRAIVRRSTCKKCKKLYRYTEDVRWREQESFTLRKRGYDVLRRRFRIECRCSQCGTQKAFYKTYAIGGLLYAPDGTSQKIEYDANELIRKDFIR